MHCIHICVRRSFRLLGDAAWSRQLGQDSLHLHVVGSATYDKLKHRCALGLELMSLCVSAHELSHTAPKGIDDLETTYKRSGH